MIANPFEVKSDTFFFASGELIVHTRAEYGYGEVAKAQAAADMAAHQAAAASAAAAAAAAPGTGA